MDKQQTHNPQLKAYSCLLLILTLCFSLSAHSIVPPEYTAVYYIDKYSTTIGRSTISLTLNEDSISYTQDVELVGVVSLFKSDRVEEESRVINNDNSLSLNKYEYTHIHSKKDRNVSVKIAESKAEGKITRDVTGTVHGEEFSLSSQNKIWDALSFQLALINDVSNNSDDYNYDVLFRGKLTPYNFKVIGKETIELNDNEFKTIKLEWIRRKRTTNIWLSIEQHYIPVLIEKYKNDNLDFTMSLDTVKFKGEKIEQTPEDEF